MAKNKINPETTCATCLYCFEMDDIGQAECRYHPPCIKADRDPESPECDLYPLVGVHLNCGWDYQFKCSRYVSKEWAKE